MTKSPSMEEGYQDSTGARRKAKQSEFGELCGEVEVFCKFFCLEWVKISSFPEYNHHIVITRRLKVVCLCLG